MFEIRIPPETPTERKAVLQLVQMLAGMEPGPGPADAHAKTSSAPVAEPPASTAEDCGRCRRDRHDRLPSAAERRAGSGLQRPAGAGGAPGLRPGEWRGGLKKVLDRFGARRVSDIKPEQYAEVMTIARGEVG